MSVPLHPPEVAAPPVGQEPSYLELLRREGWRRAELLVAVLVTFLIAMRIRMLPQQLLTLGDLLVFGLTPLWFPVTRRYLGARGLIFIGLFAVPFGAVLSLLNDHDHRISRGAMAGSTVLMLVFIGSFGFLIWARDKLGSGGLAVAFGFGLLVGVPRSSNLYPTNPWKFGFSLAVTVLVLGAVHMIRHRGLELGAVIVLALVSALTDARSSFAILVLTAALLVWQLRPLQSTRRNSAIRGVLGLGLLALGVYNFGQAAILDGFLGAKTQLRSLQQVDESGSLILGGRPELAATVSLMRDHPAGYGSGTIPNYHDILVAKTGMTAVNYDPDNGYVERYMFGSGFSLHSVIGELWAKFGLVGIVMAVFVLILTLRRVGWTLTGSAASGILLYVSLKTLWNLSFGPWYSSMSMLMLSLALCVVPRSQPATGRPPDNLRDEALASGQVGDD
jgi:hypothetical protein